MKEYITRYEIVIFSKTYTRDGPMETYKNWCDNYKVNETLSTPQIATGPFTYS
jgi:hypothetical protein